jgi:formylglycine-generating enzyme required for sulfatase activity
MIIGRIHQPRQDPGISCLMPDRPQLTVFVGAPHDVTAERRRLMDIVTRWPLPGKLGVSLRFRDFHEVMPGMGRPQQQINEELPVDEWDLFVGILWHRFGQATGIVDPATGDKLTGTQEEFERAYEHWQRCRRPRIMFYRCIRKANVKEIDPDQLNRVNRFFSQFQAHGRRPGFYKEFTTIADFERKVREDLESFLVDAVQDAAPSPPVASNIQISGKEYAFVPGGPFTLGTSRDRIEELARLRSRDELSLEDPAHRAIVPAYYIGRYPVTQAEYAAFVQATGRPVPYRSDPYSKAYSWDQSSRAFPSMLAEAPVVLVTWRDAAAYCRWIGGRLPSEAEWEKAARGVHAWEWPWGDTWLEGRCNSAEGGPRRTSRVGDYSPQGDSPYGVGDMAGNVWEWCSSLLRPYPYRADDGREDTAARGPRVLRGGAFDLPWPRVRAAARNAAGPDDSGYSIGFRVAFSHPLAPVK